MASDSGDQHHESNGRPKRPRPSGLRPPWPKGVSGNPKGRPKKLTWEELIDRALERCARGATTTKREKGAEAFADLVAAGDAVAQREYSARKWPVVQKHDLTVTPSDDESLADRLAGVARAKRANGHDLEADGPGEETPQ